MSTRFREEGSLGAFDFFSIVIWKSNRAKPHVARRLLAWGHGDLESSARALTREIHEADGEEERFEVVIGRWGFALPMGSSILAVLDPARFTVYDARVCSVLGKGMDRIVNRTSVSSLWEGYVSYREAVEAAAPAVGSLRDKDRWLWGKSVAMQLEEDIRRGFSASTRNPHG